MPKYLIALAMLLSCQLHAQIRCNPVFQKVYGGESGKDDEAISVAYCKGGGMIVGGQTTSYSAGLYDAFLMKLTDDGKPEWTRIIGREVNDKIVKVIQTADGGFIALGQTSLPDSTSGNTWVVKTDATGNVLWNKGYGTNAQNDDRPRDLIQMKDGGYGVAINLHDSTVHGSAAIVKLNSSGAIVWAKMLDNDGDDGVNALAEYNDTLLVAGYTTGDGRDAILTRLNKNNGSFIGATKFVNREAQHDEVTDVEVLQNRISFSVRMHAIEHNGGYGSERLTHFKLNSAGDVVFQRQADVSTATGLTVENVRCRATDDYGFIYLANDSTAYGYSACVKVGPYGQEEWGREFHDIGYAARTTGMDITGNHGFVFAGFLNDYFVTSQKNKIQLFKTGRLGKTESCKLEFSLDFIDTAQYQFNDFTWLGFSTSAVQVNDVQLTLSSQTFIILNSCEKMVCDTVQVIADGCNANLSAEYTTELNLDGMDVYKANDGGYVLAGNYSYYSNLEPAIVKTKPNGDVDWAKTYKDVAHDASFLKVVPSAGNTFLAMGNDSYTINHGISDSAFVIKLDYMGDLIWAKKYARSGAAFSDIQPTDDGGFVVTENENYGSGSGQHTIVFRMDTNGDIMWKKEVYSRNLVVRNLLFAKNNLYVVSNAYINYDEAASISVLKLDAKTGDLIWTKTYRSDRTENMRPFGLEMSGDTLLVAVEIYFPIGYYQYRNDAGFLKINIADGSSYGGFRITNIQHNSTDENTYFGQTNSNWATRSGNDIVFAGAASPNNNQSLYLTRVTTAGSLVWSKKYTNFKTQLVNTIRSLNDGFVITGTNITGQAEWNTYRKSAFILKTDEQGDISSASLSDNCVNSNYTANVQPLLIKAEEPMIDSVRTLPEGLYYGTFNSHDFSPYVRDIKAQAKVYCNTVSNCNKLNIIGTDTICSFTNVVDYRLEKNAGCTAAGIWQVDSAYASVVGLTDSTIQLRFKKPGSVKLQASITSGCTGLTAEKMLYIPQLAGSVSLGPDTVICANNSYTLNASEGFKSYKWSVPAAHDSILIVSAPGNYSVSVTDFCNNTSSDIVSISAANFAFSAGPDVSKCNSDTVEISATPGFINYKWGPSYNIDSVSPGKVRVYPAADTSYFVQAEKWPGCFVNDTVKVVVNRSPAVRLGNDTSLCMGDTLTLTAPGNFTRYNWSNGESRQNILVSLAGTYVVEAVTKEGCHSFDTIQLSSIALPVVNLNKNNSLCLGDARTLDAGNFVAYKWQDGSANRTFTAQMPGTYFVQVTNQQGCKGSDTTRITKSLPLPSAFLPADTTICSYGSLDIQPTQNFKSYRWSTNATTKMITVSQPGTYSLQVTDVNGCIGSDSISLYLKNCLTGLYVPTAFTPNNDGKNDQLKAMLFGDIKTFNFNVYNRFGQLVFQSSSPALGWNGKLNGVEQNSGTYVWTCSYRLGDAQPVTEKGTFVLLR